MAECPGQGEVAPPDAAGPFGSCAMADFSAAYPDQNERDHAAFAAAVDTRRLAAQTGV